MNAFLTIIVLSLTVEALIEYGKLIFTTQINWTQIAALLMGVFLSLVANTDLYALVGIDFSIPIVDTILTGILFSRGANWMADFISRIQQKAGGN